MNYQELHDRIIVRALIRPKPAGITEKHHIIPKCFHNGKYKSFSVYPWNCAILTLREHFIVHKVLVKIYQHKDKKRYHQMVCAMHKLSGTRHNVTSRDYEFMSKHRSIAQLGVKKSDEHKRKIGEGNAGKVRTDEVKQRISASRKKAAALVGAWNKGVSMTTEQKQKLSKSKSIPVIIDGIEYDGIMSAEKILGVTKYFLQKRIRQSLTGSIDSL